MTQAPPSATLVALATVVVLLPVALGFAAARLTRRRARDEGRRRVRRVAAAMAAHLRGRLSAATLNALVRRADAATFWSALETRLLRPSRAERRRLGEALGRNRHVAAERRVLLVDSPLRRELAARRLGLLPCPASRRALRRALAATSDATALAAARSLATMGDAPTLRWLLEHAGHLRGRSAAEWSTLLRAFGARALVSITASLDAAHPETAFLRGAIEAIGHGRDAAAAPALERLLRHPEVDVRVAAARALGRLACGPSLEPLVGALRDPAWQVRAQAAWALGRLGEDAAVPALASSLADREWWVRRHAAYALSRLGESGVTALAEAAARSSDRYAREIAAEALAAVNRGC